SFSHIRLLYSSTSVSISPPSLHDALPIFQMSFSSDLNYKRFSFGFLWDWKHGGDIINLTQLLFDAFGNSPDQEGVEQQLRKVDRSEEHTSELQHQIISYAVFCLKKKKNI